jgi:spore coat protein CotH
VASRPSALARTTGLALVLGWLVVSAGRPQPSLAAEAPAIDPAKHSADDFFGLSRIYTFELTVAADNYRKMPPAGGRGGRGLGGGRAFLGLAGDGSGYPKVPATLRFEGRDWGALAIRYKGNSSYRGAPSALKRSLKLDFDDPDRNRTFFGLSTLNLNNNAFDPSQMRETLSYDIFRRAGVPAPRTAYARVYLTVPGQYEREYAGLFTVIEQVDQRFFKERWHDRVGLLLKPEGLRGLPDLGDDWKAYERAYSSKLTATSEDAARFIAFTKFVNGSTDEEFARRLGEYLDVDEFLRFLAAEVVTVNSDSPLSMNHNFWLTLHPKTHKVVWIPWDMNMSFGGFRSGDADLSLHQPAGPGLFPLAERMLATKAFADRYDAIVRDMMKTNFSAARLNGEIERIAAAIRDAVAADAATSAADFERQLANPDSRAPGQVRDRPTDVVFFGGRNAPPLGQFVADRIESVALQLDGKSAGTPGRGGRGGFLPPGARIGPR